MDVGAEIESFIHDGIMRGSGIGAIGADEDLLTSGVLDSYGLLELVGFVQERYGIVVVDEDLTPENFASLARIETFVALKRATGT